jgi:phosphoribosylglycinamide formyltransferase-1
MMLKLGVLISGNGTNLQAIIDAIGDGKLDAQVMLVISSNPEAYGLKRAYEAGIPTMALSKEAYNDKLQADVAIRQELQRAGVTHVVMAGYMRMVGSAILDVFGGRVINIHPALLPSFKGAHAIKDAYEYGVKVTGVTVHVADATYDTGPILAQEAVRVQDGWTLEELEAAIHDVEHKLYPQTLERIASGEITL